MRICTRNFYFSGTYSCTCLPGYFPAETNEHGASECEDVNECDSDGINLCPPDAYCSYFNGEFGVGISGRGTEADGGPINFCPKWAETDAGRRRRSPSREP